MLSVIKLNKRVSILVSCIMIFLLPTESRNKLTLLLNKNLLEEVYCSIHGVYGFIVAFIRLDIKQQILRR